MGMLALRALAELVVVDTVGLAGFKALHRLVRTTHTARASRPVDPVTVQTALRRAAVLYFKQTHCLQRSVVLTRMLRRRGVNAQMVIGYQPVPPASHAWVEVDGEIINETVPNQDKLIVLDRW